MGVRRRLTSALRPKTESCYASLFRSFVAFCVCVKLNIFQLNVMHVLSYIEYLITQKVTANMLANHVSACRAKFIMNDLQFDLWDHPNVRYLLRSVKINRPISVARKHVIDLNTLHQIVALCENMYLGQIFKAVFYWPSLASSGCQTLPLIHSIHLTPLVIYVQVT